MIINGYLFIINELGSCYLISSPLEKGEKLLQKVQQSYMLNIQFFLNMGQIRYKLTRGRS